MKIKDLEIMNQLRISLGQDMQILLILKNMELEIKEEEEDNLQERQPLGLQQEVLQNKY